jgi:CRISPR/Cas system-associated exonuclease Cas4 (RecB family)
MEGSMSKAIIDNEERVYADFEKLSRERKKEVADFIAYLRVKEELEATKEIISDKDFLKSIMKGDEDFKAGRFKKWSEVRENV